jgi:choline dehydrogenase-like flavoprotein
MMWFDKLVELEPLASLLKPGGQRLPKTFPDKIESPEQATAMLRQCVGTNYHPACTCPMMSRELGGVVSDRLIVHGTKNLRVCDASIFPIIPRGNILSSVYACAEKGADIIKQDILSRR